MSEDKENGSVQGADDNPRPSPETSPLSPNEARYIPEKKNVTNGDMRGIQVSDITGDINYYASVASEKADLIVRYAAPQDIEDVRSEFVVPGGFAAAVSILRKESVVVLCGEGTGRTFTARRMLVDDLKITKIADMNRSRTIGSIREPELEQEAALVLDLRGTRDRPFTDLDFTQCLRVVKDAGCRLVILLDHLFQTPNSASKHAVALTAPSAVEVALATLRRRGHVDGPVQLTIKGDLAAALEGASPDKAVRAADLAVQVQEGEIEVAAAITSLKEEVTDAVARWFEDLDVRGHAYSFAVAVLENQPVEHVWQRAWALDQNIRKARLPDDGKLRPRCPLIQPSDQTLREIRATVEERAHPKHKDLKEETIRFERHDWARGVFMHMWRQYPAAQEILRDWMCEDATFDRFQAESVKAVCDVVRNVPAHEPLAVIENLASQRLYGRRALAARAMEVLMDDDIMRPLVEKTIERWTRYGNAYEKWTVARVYSSEFGRRNLTASLAKLTEIGKSEKYTPQNAVVFGVLSMLATKEIRGIALDTVVSWTGARYRRTGLQSITLALGLWVIGFYKHSQDYFVEFAEAFPKQVTDLFKHVLADPEFGELLLEHLGELAIHARWDEEKASELIRLTRLIAPDLSWWRRRDAVEAVIFQHPTKRSEIHRIFRIARKVQKARKPQPA
ncbi:hypothetical protein OG205_28860 [Lentzea sp. NBC_00516]|uniref:hypothetical protein n=1 Tax=Lentzea sp. NBC_00516 TaxID=2903582 RepID=UPI002E81E826|nr:hypothetical protein [Lentzea sp. NBC_00516]WUD22097.1 hypothetical protein OG205_28860 [Lentzea sp. NBC_00516]